MIDHQRKKDTGTKQKLNTECIMITIIGSLQQIYINDQTNKTSI